MKSSLNVVEATHLWLLIGTSFASLNPLIVLGNRKMNMFHQDTQNININKRVEENVYLDNEKAELVLYILVNSKGIWQWQRGACIHVEVLNVFGTIINIWILLLLNIECFRNEDKCYYLFLSNILILLLFIIKYLICEGINGVFDPKSSLVENFLQWEKFPSGGWGFGIVGSPIMPIIQYPP